MYAIVDIETTGGSARLERITEIAVYIHDGKRIVDEYSTLINPERNIPYFITALPVSAMKWSKTPPGSLRLRKRLLRLLKERFLWRTMHGFDYSFIRQEFSMLGYNFKRPLLDTVSLSRKLLPGHRSYSLGNLCKDLGIEINGRHRASGDALATVRLMELLLEKDREQKNGSLIRNRKTSRLHPALDTAKDCRYARSYRVSITFTMTRVK